MDKDLLNDLLTCETDLEGVRKRFAGDEGLYITCLNAFLDDTTMRELEQAILRCDWDGAFTAVHALKGLAGNMGFVPLFHASGEMVVLIRAGRTKEIDEGFLALKRCYDAIMAVIGRSFRPGEYLKGETV